MTKKNVRNSIYIFQVYQIQFGIFSSSKKNVIVIFSEHILYVTPWRYNEGPFLSTPDPLGIICLPYQFSWLPLVLPESSKTLLPQLSLPKQIDPFILLQKLPQWWPTVSNLNSSAWLWQALCHLTPPRVYCFPKSSPPAPHCPHTSQHECKLYSQDGCLLEEDLSDPSRICVRTVWQAD